MDPVELHARLEEVFASNSAGLMGQERALDVTPGGARAFGEFGQAQSDFVQTLNAAGDLHYGQWLQTNFFV